MARGTRPLFYQGDVPTMDGLVMVDRVCLVWMVGGWLVAGWMGWGDLAGRLIWTPM